MSTYNREERVDVYTLGRELYKSNMSNPYSALKTIYCENTSTKPFIYTVKYGAWWPSVKLPFHPRAIHKTRAPLII